MVVGVTITGSMTSNADDVATFMLAQSKTLNKLLKVTLKENTELLHRMVRTNANRPAAGQRRRSDTRSPDDPKYTKPSTTYQGPRRVTGEYHGSIKKWIYQEGTSLVGVVGTDEPYGRRLEYGFVGVDSYTPPRFYNQGPFPHFTPAFEHVQAQWRTQVTNLILAVHFG